MKFFSAAIAAAVLLAAPSSTLARGFDFNISDDSLRATYFSSANPTIPMSNAGFDAGLLYVEEDDSEAWLGHIGVGVSGDTGAQQANVMAGIGARLIGLDVETIDGAAIAIGGSVNFRVPQYQRIGAGAELYYAPEVSAFSDLDEYLEYSVAVDYQLLRDAYVYVAYRDIELGIDRGGNATLDSSVVLGFRVRY